MSWVKKIESMLLISLLVMGLIGCYSPFNKIPDTKAYLSEDRDQGWINDITYLEEVLPKAHPNLFFKVDEATYKQELDQLKEKVPEYTDAEIDFELSKIVSEMGDTHTGVNISVDEVYPLQLYWYDEGIYIIDAAKEYEQLLYSRIITLNGKPIEEVAEAFRPFFTGANEQWFKNQVMYYVTSKDLLKYCSVIDEDEITLEIESAKGEKETVKVKPVKSEDIQLIQDEGAYKVPFYKQHPYENYWYEYLPEQKILYVNYRTASQMMEKPFEIFTNEVFETLKKEDVEKLVIDIRENQGGGDNIFKPFLKKVKKCALNQKGKLFVVMGRKTYSAGINAVIKLKQQTNATIIGEAGGGRPNHFGSTDGFRLPNSDIYVRYSTKYIKNMKEDPEILEPDIKIGVSGELEKEGRDSVMEWIKQQP